MTRFCSNDAPIREGCVREPLPNGGFLEYPAGIEPYTNWKHIDGPLLYTSTRRMHWLTVFDRIQFFFGFHDLYSLDAKYRTRP